MDGNDPLLYAAKKAVGPRQLTEEETRKTAKRAFQNNPSLTSSEIGKAIGRSRQAVDSYIVDLRAATQMELNLKIFRMNRLGIPQDRIAMRLDALQWSGGGHLPMYPGTVLRKAMAPLKQSNTKARGERRVFTPGDLPCVKAAKN